MHAGKQRSGASSRAGLITFVVSWLFCALYSSLVLAGPLEEGRINPRVDEIITTGVRQRPIAQVPRSANVITANDIALSPSANILDLLAREANLNLRSYFGSAKFGGVDIRGQGDTYGSNVLVLIDGVKINSADLSGADFSSLPLDQVERIEVIRGANTVRYGGGAVGGVINILTKKTEPGVGLSASARAGSYSTLESGVGVSWANEILAFGAEGNWENSDGYRDNSDLDTDDYAAEAGYNPADWFEIQLRAEWHNDDYGLPGPVSKNDDPESTDFPLDGGKTDDDRVRLNVALGNEATGVLRLNGGLQDRTNRYKIGLADDVPNSDVIDEDDTRLEIQYDKSLSFLQRSHDLSIGLDLVQTDYSRDQYETSGAFQDSKIGDIRQTAWFVAGDFELTDKLMFSAGYREDRFRNSGGTYILDCADSDKTDFGLPITPVCVPDAPEFLQPDEDGRQSETWRNSAVEAALVYNPTEATNLFFSYAQSFRNPNADELFDSDAKLKPQTTDHYDIGVRQQVGEDIEWGLALFYSKTDDEILYSLDTLTLTPVNRNADETLERIGGEGDIRWYATSWMLLTANVGYTRAQFEDTNNYLPLVPKWTGGLGVQLQPLPELTWSVTGNYAGRRYDGNDFNNQTYDKLDDYTVVDTRFSYEIRGLMLYAGVNNVFDETYATSAYSGQYYPMPERNYYAGVTYRMSSQN